MPGTYLHSRGRNWTGHTLSRKPTTKYPQHSCAMQPHLACTSVSSHPGSRALRLTWLPPAPTATGCLCTLNKIRKSTTRRTTANNSRNKTLHYFPHAIRKWTPCADNVLVRCGSHFCSLKVTTSTVATVWRPRAWVMQVDRTQADRRPRNSHFAGRAQPVQLSRIGERECEAERERAVLSPSVRRHNRSFVRCWSANNERTNERTKAQTNERTNEGTKNERKSSRSEVSE